MHKKLFNSLMKKLIDWNNKTRNSEQIYQQKMSKYKAQKEFRKNSDRNCS